jgi:hypothetical protein
MELKPHLSAWMLALVLLVSCGTIPKTSVTEAPLGSPLASVDDSLFAHVLQRAVAPDGRISYAELRSDTELTEYLEQIALVRTDALISRSALLAFWINIHNAYVLDMIRLNPAKSIDDISGFRYAKVILTGDGQHYSLDDIEHTIIEHQFREPRAFFALFDGTRSSPKLPLDPYSGEHLSDQLDTQFREFLADSSKNYLDRRENTLYLSQVFEDYSSSLEEMSGEPLTTLIRDFAPPTMEAWIRRHPTVTISYLSDDHTINTSDITPTPSYERKSTPPRRTSGGIR